MVAVPARPGAAGSGEFALEGRRVAGGSAVLPVFATVSGLVAALGPAQPWAVLPLARVRELAAAAGIGQVALDPVMAPGTWRWQPGDLETFGQREERP